MWIFPEGALADVSKRTPGAPGSFFYSINPGRVHNETPSEILVDFMKELPEEVSQRNS